MSAGLDWVKSGARHGSGKIHGGSRYKLLCQSNDDPTFIPIFGLFSSTYHGFGSAFFANYNSVSDPHTLNADPDPGLRLITDPGFGSRIPIPHPNWHKKIFAYAILSGIWSSVVPAGRQRRPGGWQKRPRWWQRLKGRRQRPGWQQLRYAGTVKVKIELLDLDPWGCWIRIQCGSGSVSGSKTLYLANCWWSLAAKNHFLMRFKWKF